MLVFVRRFQLRPVQRDAQKAKACAVNCDWLQGKKNANEGYNSCASLAELVLCFIACFIMWSLLNINYLMTWIVSGVDRFIQLQGCYLDSYTPDEFSERHGTGDHYTPALCVANCSGLGRKYAGILRWNVSLLSMILRKHNCCGISYIAVTTRHPTLDNEVRA